MASFVDVCFKAIDDDPSLNSVLTSDIYDLPDGYGNELGRVLSNNVHVKHLQLDVPSLLSTDDMDTDGTDMLIHYIDSGSSLTTLELTRKNDDNDSLIHDLVGLLVDAAARSPSLLILHVQVAAPIDSLSNVLRRTKSITDVRICLDAFAAATSSSRNALAKALESNQMVESLSLGTHNDGNDACVFILPALVSHPTVSELLLAFGCHASMDQFRAQADFLRSTTTLEQLTLWNYELNQEALALVFEALQANGRISKLKLVGCHFDAPATTDFIRFMQDSKHNTPPVVKELFIAPRYESRSQYMFHGSTIAEVSAAMLQHSSLEVLSLGENAMYDHDTDEFFRTLTRNASKISLATLRITDVAEFGMQSMVRFLRVTTTLRHIEVSNVGDDFDSTLVLSAIRQNGSLHHVDIQRVDDENVDDDKDVDETARIPAFRGSMRLRLDAYLERNRELPLMLARPRLYDSDRHAESNLETTDDGSAPFTSLLTFPILYEAAQQAPRMATNNMLIGLLAAGVDGMGPLDSIEHDQRGEMDQFPDAKRRRLS